jgi:PAS domain S-box-containing protein
MMEYTSGVSSGASYRRLIAMTLDASSLEPHAAAPSALADAQRQQVTGDRGLPPCKALEPRRVQEVLPKYETYYSDLVAGSLQGICMLNRDGIIQFVNPVMATLSGYASPEDLCGRDVRTLLAPHEHAPWEVYRHACLQAPGVPQRHIVQGIRQDQSAFWLEICVSSTSWQGLPAMLVTCLDITERQHLETQVRQSHKMHALGALAGGIAHDFNNMLAAILGYTELLMDDVPRESLAWHRLQRVLTAGERAKDLVRQILTVSRQQEQERRPVQLRLLAEEILKLLRASLPVTIAIHQHLAPHVGTVLADQTQIYQVLMNLCINAEHAMRLSGGVLEVGLDEVDVTEPMPITDGTLIPGPYVRLTVRDTGHGIPDEILDHIFEPFFTTKVPDEGTGMGLTVVQGIMRNHDGAIHVTSLPDQGSTFTLYFPRFHKPMETSTPPAEPVPGGVEWVLFVDDEEPIARLGCMMLERLGYKAKFTTSGDEALALFRTAPERFDLVITDHTMPGMTGAALAQELRRLRPELPVILCSGFSHTMNADKAQALGLDAFLLKPFLHRDLGLAVHRVLAQRRAQSR